MGDSLVRRPWASQIARQPLALLVLAAVLALLARSDTVNAAVPVAPVHDSARLLVLMSYPPAVPSVFSVVSGIEAGLAEAGIGGTRRVVDIEFLDAGAGAGRERFAGARAGLAAKFAARPGYDVVVTTDDDLLDFALDEEDGLFAGVPIVFLGVTDTARAEAMNADPRVTGVVEAVSMRDTLRLMREHAENGNGGIAVVADGTPRGVANLATFESNRDVLDDLPVQVLSLDHLTFAGMADALRRIPAGWSVLHLGTKRDATGRQLGGPDGIVLVAHSTRAPVFTLWDYEVGSGFVGGRTTSQFEQGRIAGGLAARIAEGVPPAAIPVTTRSPNRYLFDFVALQRAGIATDMLPSGAVILHRPPSFLERNRYLLVGMLALIGLLAASNAALVANIRRRRRSERAMIAQKDEVSLANRAMTDFLHNMSHELRTPLNAIIGFSEMIGGQFLGPVGNDRYLGYAGDIRASALHLLGVISDILDLAVVQRGEIRLDRAEVRIGLVLDACLEMIAPKAHEKRVHLSAIDQTDGTVFLLDERRLKQALINLLANAVKFSREQGWISVRAIVETDGTLVLSVVDNGIGIARSEIRTIFKPFVRVASSKVRDYDGIGLGLAITKEIVEAHGGSLGVESELGRGSTFSLRLPGGGLPSARQNSSERPALPPTTYREEHAA